MRKEIQIYKGKSIILGSINEFLSQNHFQFFKKLAPYGDIVKSRIGISNFIFMFKPEYIKHVLQGNYKNYIKDFYYKDLTLAVGNGLVTSEGKLWKQQRKLIQPAFHKKNIDNFSNIIKEEVLYTINQWSSLDNPRINLTNEMKALTMSIVSRCLFSADIRKDSKYLGDAIGICLDYLNMRMETIFRIPGKPIFPTANYKNFKSNYKIIQKALVNIIETKRKNINEPEDLLDMLILAQDEDSGRGMSNVQLVDEIMTLFLAGHETTATTLTWTYFLLNKFPEINKKFQNELSKIPEANKITMEEILNCSYTDLLTKEVMRFYPVVWAVGREAVIDDNIEGYKIPKGVAICLPILYMHYHPNYWDNPELFNPDRFIDINVEKDLKWIYMPFGEGPRKCIGNNFAQLETQIITTLISKTYKLVIEDQDQITIHNGVTSKPNKDIFARVESNSDSDL